MVEKSNHTAGPDDVSKFTSRTSPEKRLAANAQPPVDKFGLRIESDRPVLLFFHKRTCKLTPGGTQVVQAFHQGEDDVCRKIHQQTFGNPKCALSRIEPIVDQRFSPENGGTQINCNELHPFNSDFGTGAYFVTLRRGMIDLPKLRGWKLPLQFGTERIKACAEYDDLGNPISKC